MLSSSGFWPFGSLYSLSVPLAVQSTLLWLCVMPLNRIFKIETFRAWKVISEVITAASMAPVRSLTLLCSLPIVA